MPAAAFADLWATLHRGEMWSALVKNRRKNGDHYWVEARVTPVKRDGRITGYMSVRTKPTREQIHAAEVTYAELGREGSKLLLNGGRPQRGGFARIWRQLNDWPRWLQVACAYLGNLVLLLALCLYLTLSAAPKASVGWIILGLAAAFSAVCYRWQRRYLAGSLEQVTEMTMTLAGGSVSSQLLEEPDGMAGPLVRALNQLNVNLQALIGDIRNGAEHIFHSAAEIAAGNFDLSARTEAQASSLEQTASSMEQFSATVAQNAAGADNAAKLTAEAASVAERAGGVVADVGKKMNDISASSQRVTDIIGMIDSIAFQTNILALNAAVEAARAGEQGRGFAVVASEVRALAQRSAAAAKEIKVLVAGSMEDVQTGNALVANAVRTMGEVQSSVGKVATIVEDIARASREQALGVQQVNAAVSHLDQVTQENAALVEQAAAAAGSVNSDAQVMHDAVGVFRISGSAADGRGNPSGRIDPARHPRLR
jgi:aerotaxis receptor